LLSLPQPMSTVEAMRAAEATASRSIRMVKFPFRRCPARPQFPWRQSSQTRARSKISSAHDPFPSKMLDRPREPVDTRSKTETGGGGRNGYRQAIHR
jgi:hypothetical protein